MCLAQRYGALDVEPPPTLYVESAGAGHRLSNETRCVGGRPVYFHDQHPCGLSSDLGKGCVERPQGKKENREFNFAFSVAGKSQGIEHTVVTYDGVVLSLDPQYDSPPGCTRLGTTSRRVGRRHVCAGDAILCSHSGSARRVATSYLAGVAKLGYEALERKAAQDQAQQDYQRNLLEYGCRRRAGGGKSPYRAGRVAKMGDQVDAACPSKLQRDRASRRISGDKPYIRGGAGANGALL